MGQPKPSQCGFCAKHFTDQSAYDDHTAEHIDIDRFRCPTCGKEFIKPAELAAHKKKHVPRLCLECGKLFANSASLMIHMRSHSGIKPYSCPTCGKQFTQWVNFNRHTQLHSGIKSFVCSICSRAFARLANLQKHELAHGKARPFCEICGKSFKVGSFAKHMQMHAGECPICAAPLTDIKQYRYHMTRMHGAKRNGCHLCAKKFNTYRTLMEHVHEVHDDEERDGEQLVECFQCKRTFKSAEKRKHHNCFVKEQREGLKVADSSDAIHSRIEVDNSTFMDDSIMQSPNVYSNTIEEIDSSCEDFDTLKNLDANIFVRPRNEEPPIQSLDTTMSAVNPVEVKPIESPDDSSIFKCDICSDTFDCISSIKEHMDKVHISKPRKKSKPDALSTNSREQKSQTRFTNTDPDQRLECDICHHSIKNRRGMIHHMAIHMSPAFHCPHCSKSFSRRSILTLHLGVHTKERPYQCEKCAKKFTQLGDLKKHLRTHTGQHSIFCPHCGRGFYDKSTYNRHLTEIHSENPPKPYACPVCHRCFARANTRNTHLRVHRNDTQLPTNIVIPADTRRYVCEVCQKTFPMEAFLRRHMRKHSDERPFSCADCGLWYKQKQTLLKHLASRHSGGDLAKTENGGGDSRHQVECTLCGIGFVRESNLRQHWAKKHAVGL